MPHYQPSARKSLAEVVVRLALQLERESTCRKGAEALPRRARELEADSFFRQADITVAPGNLAGESGTNGAIRIADRQRSLHALASFECRTSQLEQRSVQAFWQLQMTFPRSDVVALDAVDERDPRRPGEMQQR